MKGEKNPLRGKSRQILRERVLRHGKDQKGSAPTRRGKKKEKAFVFDRKNERGTKWQGEGKKRGKKIQTVQRPEAKPKLLKGGEACPRGGGNREGTEKAPLKKRTRLSSVKSEEKAHKGGTRISPSIE